MSLVSEPFFGWVPDVHKKLDSKQITFKIPQELLALTRKILFKRYACDVTLETGKDLVFDGSTKTNITLTLKSQTV